MWIIVAAIVLTLLVGALARLVAPREDPYLPESREATGAGAGDSGAAGALRRAPSRAPLQLFLLMVMVGNLLEKSLDCWATFTATLRAMSL